MDLLLCLSCNSWLFVGFLEKWDLYVTDALKAECSCSTPQIHPPQNPVLHQDTGAHARQRVRVGMLSDSTVDFTKHSQKNPHLLFTSVK